MFSQSLSQLNIYMAFIRQKIIFSCRLRFAIPQYFECRQGIYFFFHGLSTGSIRERLSLSMQMTPHSLMLLLIIHVWILSYLNTRLRHKNFHISPETKLNTSPVLRSSGPHSLELRTRTGWSQRGSASGGRHGAISPA